MDVLMMPVELVFDQTIGHLFVARVAGNMVTPEIAASLEYSVAVLGVKVVLVLGHTGCGALKAAMKAETVPGQISGLYKNLRPAVEKSGGDVAKAIDYFTRALELKPDFEHIYGDLCQILLQNGQSARAKELAQLKASEMTLREFREKFGGDRVSDDDKLLNFFAGAEALAAMKAAGAPKVYPSSAGTPLVALIEQLSRRKGTTQIYVKHEGFSLRLERKRQAD